MYLEPFTMLAVAVVARMVALPLVLLVLVVVA
jgi:hypothetical protein